VALVDISMPENSGVEVTRKLKEISPETKVLALTMHEDIQNITGMIEAGASGYIFKRTSMDEVLEAIRTVARNEKYLSRNVQAVLVDSMKHKSEVTQNSTEKVVNLSVREREILSLIAREFNNEAIANKLFISERTVEAHRRNIFTKTKTKTIVGLMKFAMKHHLIDFNNEL
jgi:DNA-binding NarL/FixJ family response regulator